MQELTLLQARLDGVSVAIRVDLLDRLPPADRIQEEPGLALVAMGAVLVDRSEAPDRNRVPTQR